MKEVSHCGGTPLFFSIMVGLRVVSALFVRDFPSECRSPSACGERGDGESAVSGFVDSSRYVARQAYFSVLEVPDNVSELVVGRVSRWPSYALPSVLRNCPGRPQAFPRPFHRFGGNGLRYSPYSAISRSTRTGMPSAERIGMCSTGLRMPDRSGRPGSTTQTGASGRRYRTSEAAG